MQKEKIEKTIYFVRHGQSVDNVSPVFQSIDSPLSEVGWKQAALIAKRVANLSFDLLIASPHERTKQTAETIARETNKKPVFSNLFVERAKPTSVSGKPYTDKAAVNIYYKWSETLYKRELRVEDGENFDDLIVRADKALAFLKNRSEKNIVVVTHGFFLRTMIARVLLGNTLTDKSYKNYMKVTYIENTGLTILKYQDQSQTESDPCWHLWILNDHAHLAE